MYLIPFGIWFALRSWKPKTRKRYAAKFSLWSFIIFSHYLGYPIARAIFGVESSYLPGLDHAIPGVIVAGFMGSPITFGIGYLIAGKKFK